MIWSYLANNSVTTPEHPLYTPDLAPADLFLFPQFKMSLKDEPFAVAEVVKQNATEQLKELSQNEFLKSFDQLYDL